MEYKLLSSPMNIGNIEIKNRVVMAPMLMGFGRFDGRVTEQMMDYYEERAKGGTGLIITEVTRVNDFNGSCAFAQLAMSHDYQINSVHELAQRVQKHGAKLFVQLHHPGRQNMGLLIGTVPLSIAMDKMLPFYSKMLYSIVPAGKLLMEKHIVPKVVSPSKCENSYFSDGVNRALKKSEIKKLVADFVAAAIRVKKAGADGVELHASHGYLIQQFLSPYTNRRTDEYGGSLHNRMRFLLEIISGIRRECGKDFPLIVRLTVDECYDKIGKPGRGYDLTQGVEMARRLEMAGVDAIDVSSASYDTFSYWLEPTSFECGWRAYMAQAVKEAVSIPVIAANLIRSPEQAEKQLRDGVQDFISLGRPHIADPHWTEKALGGREKEIKRCMCCLYCIESMQNNAYTGSHGCCSVNPFVGKEKIQLEHNGDGRTVVVVGAGPAGLTAAELAAKRGFKVIVLEKNSYPGGQLALATKPPHKEKLAWCIEDLMYAATQAGAEILFNVTADAEMLTGMKPYAVIAATGGNAIHPRSIEGSELPNVFTVTDILSGKHNFTGKKVAVIGSGMTGLETAELLASQGNSVFVVEMADAIAPGTWMQHRDDILPRLRSANVNFYLSEKLVGITPDGVRLQNVKSKEERFVEADFTVLSLGVRSDDALYLKLLELPGKELLVGDAQSPGRVFNATSSAFEAVMSL